MTRLTGGLTGRQTEGLTEGPAGLWAPAFGLLVLAALGPLISIVSVRALGSLPVVCAVLCLGGYYAARQRLPRLDRAVPAALAAFLALAGLSALWAPDPAFVLERVVKATYLAGAGLVLHAVARELDERVRDRLAGILLAAFALGTAGVFAEVVAGFPLHRAMHGMGDQPWFWTPVLNRAAVILALLAWPALLAARRLGWPRAGLALPPAALAAVAVTDSQSALVGAAVGIAVYPLARLAPTATRRTLAAAVAVGFLTAPALALALYHLTPAVPVGSQAGWEATSVIPRLEIWEAVARRILDKPVLGWGVEAIRHLPDLLDPRTAPHMLGQTRALHPHNAALQVWAELGGAGAAALTALMLLVFRRIGRLAGPAHAAALAAYTAILTIAVISHGLWQSWWFGLVGTTAALLALAAPADRDA